jgi:ribosomal protein S12 methylthiotransferase accessory factor
VASGASSITSKGFKGGTHRLVSPEETLARVTPLMPAMGITRLADVTGLDCIGIPVVMAHRPNARSLAVSPGKGLDLVAAKVSAVMEAIEGWHAERIIAPLLLASINEMRFERPLADLGGLPRVFRSALDPDARLLWIAGSDLLAAGSCWVPFEVVDCNYTHPLPPRSGCFLASSNGLASGNHLAEAMSHAICELVERDAAALWTTRNEAQRDRTRIALETVDDPSCRALIQRFAAAGIAVGCWEITSDVGLPAFRCVITDADVASLRTPVPGVGAGCHPSRAVALLRALTEAAQTRLTLISGARDDMGVARLAAVNDRGRHEQLLAALERSVPRRSFTAVETQETESIEEDLAWELHRVRAIGVTQVIAIELTKPAIGIPVVRVVIPGLEGIHDAPGYVTGPRCRRQAEAR